MTALLAVALDLTIHIFCLCCIMKADMAK